MLRPLLLAILLCFSGSSALAYSYAWNEFNSVKSTADSLHPKNGLDDPIRFSPASPVTPVVARPLPDRSQSLQAGSFSIDLADVFTDTDGNTLNFSAVSNNRGIATVDVQGTLLTVTPVSTGTCRIRTTAKDNSNGKADDTFTLVIGNNQPPTLATGGTLDNKVLFTGGDALELNLSSIFLDPDGDLLIYGAESAQENIAEVSLDQSSLTIQPLEEGETLISLSANDQNGGILLESFKVEVMRGYPSLMAVNVQLEFSDYRDQGNYRMVALPGDQFMPLSNVAEGQPNEDWVAYVPDTSANGRLIPYEQTSRFILRPGGGLWFLSKEDLVQTQVFVPTVDLNDNGAFEIPLRDGWNMISNPLDIDIPWSIIAEHNSVSQPIWRWSHGYKSVSTLYSAANIPEAYYFNNVEELDKLELPYVLPGSTAQKAVQNNVERAAGIANTVLAVSDLATSQTSSISINWTPDASKGFDRFDQFAPPAHFNTIDLALRPTHQDFDEQSLAVEARPAGSAVEQFELRLTASPGKYVAFNLSDSIGTAEKALLVNRRDAKTYSLSSGDSQQIYLDSDVTQFSLLIGQSSDIEKELEHIKPEIFSLKQNYPNPFYPTTTIEYSIPDPQHIDLSVYDLMGRLVITLQHGEQDAGLHRVLWHGLDQYRNSVANGVYFYRIQSDSWSQSRKMTLIR
ncbi:MAG: T9SS type A sorting domain-containing protein [Rhodothermales bacterium]